MFGFKYRNQERWFTDRMESLSTHLSFKHEENIKSSLYFYFFHAKVFQFLHPSDILNFFTSNQDKFLKYPENYEEYMLSKEEYDLIYSKIFYEIEENFVSLHLSFNNNQNYNIEIAKFIEANVPLLFTHPEINNLQCADEFCIVYDFDRETLDYYSYEKNPIFVLEQEFNKTSINQYPCLKFRLNFNDLHGSILDFQNFKNYLL